MTSLLEYVQANLITKIIFYGACFMVAALVLLYFYQDKMLYIPGIFK